MDTRTADAVARRVASVRLMLASLIVMMAAIVALYFAPLAVAPLAAASLYAGLWAYERRLGVASPVTLAMTGLYLFFTFAFHRGGDPSWTVWFSPTVHWTLAALIFVLLAAGRPFTAIHVGEAGFMPLHRMTSLVWGGLHLAAGLAALTLIPGPGFLYVPLGLMALGAFATIWLNFVSMGPGYGRPARFELEGYSFREAVSREDREAFGNVIAEAYRADLQGALGPRRKLDTEAIIREHRASDHERQGEVLPFLAFSGGRPVGGICLFFDHRRRGLPIEGEAQLDLDPWRRAGTVAEVGRLGVLRRYRINPSLLRGLFKCVVEAAAERRIHFIFNDSFEFQAAMYEKIGFRALHDKRYVSKAEHSTGYGLEVQPMMMDLAAMVRADSPSGATGDVYGLLAPYVMERFFKHLVIREMAEAFPRPKRNPGEIENATV